MRSIEVATKFKQLRQVLGLSQEKCGEILGLSVGSIYKYESGKVIPRADVIDKLKQMAVKSGVSMPQITARQRVEGSHQIGAGPSEIDSQYIIKLQKDKIENQESELITLRNLINEKQAEASSWKSLEHHAVCTVAVHVNVTGIGRTFIKIDNMQAFSDVLGYTLDEMDSLYQVGIRYDKIHEHPIDKIITKDSLAELKVVTTTYPAMFDAVKRMVGHHYIPTPIFYRTKDGDTVPALTFNKINWWDKQVISKVRFLNSDDLAKV